MQEIKGTEINEVKKPEHENFKNIKPENGMNIETAKKFWESTFKKGNYDFHMGDMVFNSDNRKVKDVSLQSMERVSEKIISNQDEKKEIEDSWGVDLNDSKPEQSPVPEKWFEKGGQIRIEENDGKIEWTYINKEGIEVKYVDGYPVFPQETKHPFIGDINIGSFTGDRNKDKELYKEKLYEEYGLTDKPTGYVIHHDSENGNLQLIKTEYHTEFTHEGGHSKYKEETNNAYSKKS